jgi:hypothetical protein
MTDSWTEAVKSIYAEDLQDIAIVRRYSGSGPTRTHSDVYARCRIFGNDAEQLIDVVEENILQAIVFVPDLTDAGMTMPLTTSDKIVFNSKEYAIMFPDNASRMEGEELVAYEILIKG